MLYIPLSNFPACTIVDDNFLYLNNQKWSLNNCGYVQGYIDKKVVLLHRVVINAQAGQEVDHINGNKLDNQFSNLHFVSHSENMLKCRNRKDMKNKYKGVSWHKTRRKWYVRHSHCSYIGYFDSEIDAAIAYDEAVRKQLGSEAPVNFPVTSTN